MFYVAQVLFIVFILLAVVIVSRKVDAIVRFTAYIYFSLLTAVFAYVYITNSVNGTVTDIPGLINIFGLLYIIPLILLVIIMVFGWFRHIENWQKVILIFASLVNGLLVVFIFNRLFFMVFYQLV